MADDGDDVHVETEEHDAPGFGDKLKGSVGGMLFGFVLFVASFYILYKGETRVDRSKIVAEAAAVTPHVDTRSADGQTVKVRGEATCPSPVTDPQFVPGGKYLHLARHAEMYAWAERTESKTQSKQGASGRKRQKTTKTTHYEKRWTSSPANSSSFKKPSGHSNPPMAVQSHEWTAPNVAIGDLRVDLAKARVMGAESLSEPAPEAPTFDPADPKGQGQVAFEGVPTVDAPLTLAAAKGKPLVLYMILKETYSAAGRWDPGKTTLKAAAAIRVGQVKISTQGLKAEGMERLGKRLYKPKAAATKPVAGNERATIFIAQAGQPLAFSGTIEDDTLKNVTVSPSAGGAGAGKSPWYIGRGSPGAPVIGDVRLTFTGVPNDTKLFVCGRLQDGKLVPTFERGVSFMAASTMTEPEVVAALRGEHRMWKWIARIGGFLCMWIGMCLMVGPLTFLLQYIPVLGSLASGMIQLAFGLLALVLTLVTILLVKLFWVIVVASVAGVGYGAFKMAQAKARPQNQ